MAESERIVTPVSDGKPLRRLLVTSKAHVVFIDRFHGTPPWWLMVTLQLLVVRGGHDPPAFAL